MLEVYGGVNSSGQHNVPVVGAIPNKEVNGTKKT
jgi:hypothetical protein